MDLIHLTQLPELFERTRARTLQGVQPDPEMEEILRLRRDGAKQRQLVPEQESILGASPDQPVELQDNVIQYFRQMGIPDEMIFRELGIGATR